jgi:hypothetical protein
LLASLEDFPEQAAKSRMTIVATIRIPVSDAFLMAPIIWEKRREMPRRSRNPSRIGQKPTPISAQAHQEQESAALS